MKRQTTTGSPSGWRALHVPGNLESPRPVVVRAQTVPPRHHFPEHAHDWNQLVYAISGVLTVAVEGSCLVVPPEQAVWVPTGSRHRVGSLGGAEFRSLYVADVARADVMEATTVFAVSPLLRALIIEAAALAHGASSGDEYDGRVVALIVDQLRRLQPVRSSLPWPRQGPLLVLCEALYDAPADGRELEAWGRSLGMSSRTLARRFELGMGLRAWRRRLRLFRAVELLGGGASVTEAALELGYASSSAFIYMFRSETGRSPRAHQRIMTNG